MTWLAHPGLRAFALYLIIFTQMLDTSVANLALSNIASDLFMDVYHAAWIITSFGTGIVLAFPLGSIWTKRASADFILCVGCMIFLFASIGCGLANDPSTFIFFRLVQGIGSGMAVIVSFPIMIGIFGSHSAAFAIALCTSAVSLAPVMGPIVGAYVTDLFGWRMLFLMNVPLTAFSMFLLLRGFSFDAPPAPERIGPRLLTLGLFGICVSLLQIVLDFGERYDWFNSMAISITAALALAAGWGFYLMNAIPKYQLFNLSVFSNTRYTTATTILVIGNGLIFSSLVFLPLWFRLDRNMPILYAGAIISMGSGVAALATPFIGKYVPRHYFPYAAVASLAFTSLSFIMMSRFTVDVSVSYMIASRLVAGCGLAIFSTPLITMSLSTLNPADVTNGNSISIVLRVLASNILVALSFIQYQHLSERAQNRFTADADRLSFLNGLDAAASGGKYLTALFHTTALSEIFFAAGIFFALALVVLLPFTAKMK